MPQNHGQIFSDAKQNLLMELYDDSRDIITKKGNTAQINKAREAAWKTIADRLNASNLGGQKRTWQQVKIKYKNILTNATKRKAQLGATGRGPPPEELTQAESLALSYNKGQNHNTYQMHFLLSLQSGWKARFGFTNYFISALCM
ncbi:uncharacterized protein LOC128029015 isoform X2 [Xyrichtys novacula]|uniref:Uncharacterized protein LOC128029015 isoform X2 n=1 Tax=Xyrichtys novacula TaxID=13765 RepID=A0AAV1HFB0_XYRNO|nr:uncharacterized protein LOC128029015 isoform X2 [Xyrichtys novacula]